MAAVRYLIRKAVLAPVPEIEISPEEFANLKRARTVLTSAFACEEKYEILVANYLSLEEQLLKIAATNAVRQTLGYSEFFEIRSGLNVCIVNVLTAARLYLDQMPQDVAAALSEDESAIDLIKARCSKEYDAHFEYRFMEALRNHTQHCGIPVHMISQPARRTSNVPDALMEYVVDISSGRRYLEENGKFKKAVLEEAPESIDLKVACRRYVESLSAIQEFARECMAEATASARAQIQNMHERYLKEHPECLGLEAMGFEGERRVSSVPLLLDWDDVRLHLQKRNTRLHRLSRSFVSNRANLV